MNTKHSSTCWTQLEPVLTTILTADPTWPETPLTLDRFVETLWQMPDEAYSPFARAILGGFTSDRIGFAFLAGYQWALRALVPDISDQTIISFCVTEAAGGHPRLIKTELRPTEGEQRALWGEKMWATGATGASHLLVAASLGLTADGRNRLVLTEVDAHGPGVHIEPLPETPFAPEILHARVLLDGAPALRVLPDAYTQYIRPFRTIEDLHVNGAILGHLVRVGRAFAWPRVAIEQLVNLIVAAGALAAAPPDRPVLHVALAGHAADLRRFLSDVAVPLWSSVPAEIATRFKRDAQLFEVAGNARRRRGEVAWERIESGSLAASSRAPRDAGQ